VTKANAVEGETTLAVYLSTHTPDGWQWCHFLLASYRR